MDTLRLVTDIQRRIEKIENKGVLALEVFGFLDFTSLGHTDNFEKIDSLCQQVREWGKVLPRGAMPAAACVWPLFANQVSSFFKGTSVKTACVAGAFPSGQAPLELRLKEADYAIANGADEIDMVISRGRFLSGDEKYIQKEVKEFADLCSGRALLKVILETGELRDEKLIRTASRLAMDGGADFLKTSTGKIDQGATLGSFLWMADEIKRYYFESGKEVGIKAAGGIVTAEDSFGYYFVVKEVLGEKWTNRDRFRIGASRLASSLVEYIIKQ